jgi:hypothetical protein
MRKPKNLGRLALNKRSGSPRLKACDAQNMGHNRPHAVGFPIRQLNLQELEKIFPQKEKLMKHGNPISGVILLNLLASLLVL